MRTLALLCLLASSGCGGVMVCYSEGGMTRGKAGELAIYTAELWQPLPSGEVAAVALGRGSIQAARVEPCGDHSLERLTPEKLVSVTFEPPALAQLDSSRFEDGLIIINFTALEEGDGTIIVRAVFDGDEYTDRRAFRVRALADVYYQPIYPSTAGESDGPLVAGAQLPAFVFPTTATGEPLVTRVPGPGWIRPDGLLEIADYPWPSDTDIAVKLPMPGMIPVRRGTFSDWSYERTIEQTSVEVVPTSAITASMIREASTPATAMACTVNDTFSVGTKLTDGSGRTIHGGAALVKPSDASALEIHLGVDIDDLLVRCKTPGDYRLDLALPNAPASLMVHVL